jgi:ribosomal protein S18 acetylase RimI-like enzyme
VIPPGPIIRRAVADDAARIAALARRVFRATYGAAIPAPTLAAYLDERLTPAALAEQIAAPAPLLVALVRSTLAGYARLTDNPPPACLGDAGAVELGQLYVDAAHQGSGVGAALLDAACAAAEGMLWLYTWEQNTRALRFYERHGFVAVGRGAVHVRDVVFEDLVLTRRGTPGSSRQLHGASG